MMHLRKSSIPPVEEYVSPILRMKHTMSGGNCPKQMILAEERADNSILRTRASNKASRYNLCCERCSIGMVNFDASLTWEMSMRTPSRGVFLPLSIASGFIPCQRPQVASLWNFSVTRSTLVFLRRVQFCEYSHLSYDTLFCYAVYLELAEAR